MRRCKLHGIGMWGALAALLASCSSSNGSGAGGAGGEGGVAGHDGNGGTGGNELGIDDPSDHFDLFDPQQDAQGMELAAGTETALPPDEAIRAFFTAIEASGGEASLLFNHDTDGQLLHVRIPVPKDRIVTDPSGAAHVDVNIGPVTIRVANNVDSTTFLPLLVVPVADLSSLVLLKSYSRLLRNGSLGPVRLDFVSAFDAENEAAGPLAGLDLSSEPQVDLTGDCDSMAWQIASEVPAMAVKFPPIEGCSESECAIVKAAWIRANHDVMRVRQMLEYLDTQFEEQRNFLWDKPAVDPQGNPMGEETSLQFYFGGFAQYRFEAIRWAFKRLGDDMHDLDLQGLALDLECRPSGAGDVCNTAHPPAHHAVKSNIKICDEFFDQPDWYQPLIMVHEPLHHVFVPWNDNTPRLDPIQDTHTHGHGNVCAASLQTNKGYGINEVRHLATYKADNGNTCFHRNFAFRNNDTYGWVAQVIGSGVRVGAIHHWPYIPNTSPPTPEPCSADGYPDPGNGWDDPLDQCMKIGQEMVCPGGGVGGGPTLPDLDIGINCP
ncbi:MAG: hypothetical protein PVI24_04695 [Myxococcales bacterium]